MAKRAVVSGYATLDFIVRSPEPPVGARTYPAEILGGAAWPRAGGAPLYAGRRLAANRISAALVVSVGSDANGRAYRETCRADGLDVEGIAMHEGRTPACILIHHAGGGCTCFLDPGGVPERLDETQARAVEGVDLVCIAAGPTALTRDVLARVRPDQTLAWIAKADEACFPPGLAEQIARRADVIICNAGERPFVERARKGPPAGQVMVETRGADGVVVDSASGQTRYGVTPTQTSDATGAGDTFAGEFLAYRMLGASLDQAVAAAADAARALLASRL